MSITKQVDITVIPKPVIDSGVLVNRINKAINSAVSSKSVSKVRTNIIVEPSFNTSKIKQIINKNLKKEIESASISSIKPAISIDPAIKITSDTTKLAYKIQSSVNRALKNISIRPTVNVDPQIRVSRPRNVLNGVSSEIDNTIRRGATGGSGGSTDIPIEPKAKFNLGSFSKQMLGVTALLGSIVGSAMKIDNKVTSITITPVVDVVMDNVNKAKEFITDAINETFNLIRELENTEITLMGNVVLKGLSIQDSKAISTMITEDLAEFDKVSLLTGAQFNAGAKYLQQAVTDVKDIYGLAKKLEAVTLLSGDTSNFEAIARGYSRIMNSVSVAKVDFKQIDDRFPIAEMVAQKLGKTQDEMYDMMSKGMIPPDIISELFSEIEPQLDELRQEMKWSWDGILNELSSSITAGFANLIPEDVLNEAKERLRGVIEIIPYTMELINSGEYSGGVVSIISMLFPEADAELVYNLVDSIIERIIGLKDIALEFAPVFMEIATYVNALAIEIMKMISDSSGGFESLKAIVFGVGNMFKTVITIVLLLGDWVKYVIDDISNKLDLFISTGQLLFGGLFVFIGGLLKMFNGDIDFTFENFKKIVSSAIKFSADGFKAMLQAVTNMFYTAVDAILGVVQRVGDLVGLGGKLDGARTWAQDKRKDPFTGGEYKSGIDKIMTKASENENRNSTKTQSKLESILAEVGKVKATVKDERATMLSNITGGNVNAKTDGVYNVKPYEGKLLNQKEEQKSKVSEKDIIFELNKAFEKELVDLNGALSILNKKEKTEENLLKQLELQKRITELEGRKLKTIENVTGKDSKESLSQTEKIYREKANTVGIEEELKKLGKTEFSPESTLKKVLGSLKYSVGFGTTVGGNVGLTKNAETSRFEQASSLIQLLGRGDMDKDRAIKETEKNTRSTVEYLKALLSSINGNPSATTIATARGLTDEILASIGG